MPSTCPINRDHLSFSAGCHRQCQCQLKAAHFATRWMRQVVDFSETLKLHPSLLTVPTKPPPRRQEPKVPRRQMGTLSASCTLCPWTDGDTHPRPSGAGITAPRNRGHPPPRHFHRRGEAMPRPPPIQRNTIKRARQQDTGHPLIRVAQVVEAR